MSLRRWCERRRRRALIAKAYRILRAVRTNGKLRMEDGWWGEDLGWVKRWRVHDLYWRTVTREVREANPPSMRQVRA